MKRFMCIFFITVLIASIFIGMKQDSFAAKADKNTANLWGYLDMTSVITANFAFVVEPGARYNFATTSNPRSEGYLFELTTGPVFMQKWGKLAFKLPLFYCFSFAESLTGTPTQEHSISLKPKIAYKITDEITFSYRLVLQNIIYIKSAAYEGGGYSLLFKNRIGLTFKVHNSLSIFIKDEIYTGVIEDRDNPDSFDAQGLSRNRLYVGGTYKVSPIASLTIQYILEAKINPDDVSHITSNNHILKLTLGLKVDFTKKKS